MLYSFGMFLLIFLEWKLSDTMNLKYTMYNPAQEKFCIPSFTGEIIVIIFG